MTEALTMPFRLEAAGLAVGGFAEVSGLEAPPETLSHRSGSGLRHMPGGLRLRPLTLSRGVIGAPGFIDWIEACLRGEVSPRALDLLLFGTDRDEAARWRLGGAWVSGWQAGVRQAEALPVERMTLGIDKVERVRP
ncbi:phage tail protein [Vannielia litorea]|uniref:Conserved hypothetical phage tail region protein n=1 Tax=Vannielia litorea TaxID=1217970 RepID=A0A1N6FWD3_9RHOB|nr:phage tail protein [Vannielia litorea]SIN99510.1 conserved hypothetical phage tail region protein [Vannielia litorea]